MLFELQLDNSGYKEGLHHVNQHLLKLECIKNRIKGISTIPDPICIAASNSLRGLKGGLRGNVRRSLKSSEGPWEEDRDLPQPLVGSKFGNS